MGRSQDSFNKKEREKKRQKRKKEKKERKEQKKLEGKKGPEFMYLDADGNLTETPPDPTVKKEEINIEDIQISVPKSEKSTESNFLKKGIVKFFNTEKGYGFITDINTQDSIFVHIDSCNQEIKQNDRVTYEVGKGNKGPVALDVKVVTE